MLFRRSDRCRGVSIIYLTVGTLAFIGALGVTAKGKHCINSIKRKMRELIQPACGCDRDGE